jgi:hypothetical protein
MKRPHMEHAALIFTALLTIALVSRTSLAASPSGHAVAGSRPAKVDETALILTMQTPSGGMSRLTFVDKDGWCLEDHAAPTKDEARITPASTERQQRASRSEQPMTVFIDGPTGFTYAWVADHGWKFIGRLSNRNR